MSPALTIDWFNTAKFEPEYACVDRDFDDALPPIVRNGVVELHPDAWGVHDNDETIWHGCTAHVSGENDKKPWKRRWNKNHPLWLNVWPDEKPAPEKAIRVQAEGRSFFYIRREDKELLTKEQADSLLEKAHVDGVVCFEGRE